ncbi:hypothetical protein ABPG74_011544 [Tetrahymena malaccensis]
MSKSKIYKFSVSQILVKQIIQQIYQSIKYKSFQQDSEPLIKKEWLHKILQQGTYKNQQAQFYIQQSQVLQFIQDQKRELSDNIFYNIQRQFTSDYFYEDKYPYLLYQDIRLINQLSHLGLRVILVLISMICLE